MLSDLEFERYRKQLNLPEWRKAQQMALKNASILVVGAGGLSCGALPFLAAAGVGSLPDACRTGRRRAIPAPAGR